MTKTCTSCLKALGFDQFYKNSNGKFGLTNICRACHKQKARTAYAASSEAQRVRRNELGRARYHGEPTPKAVRQVKYEAVGGNKAWKKILEHDHSKQKHVKEYRNRHFLKHRYGITVEEYEGLYREQSGRCACCFAPVLPRGTFSRADVAKISCIDHCHTAKVVRGLLCPACNKALGAVKDNIWILEQMIVYLKRCAELADVHHTHYEKAA